MYSTICQLQKVMCKQWLMLLPYTEQYSKIIDLLKEPPSGRVNNYIHIAYPGTSTSLYEFNHAVRSINIVDSMMGWDDAFCPQNQFFNIHSYCRSYKFQHVIASIRRAAGYYFAHKSMFITYNPK